MNEMNENESPAQITLTKFNNDLRLKTLRK